MTKKIAEFIKKLYQKLFKIDDTPQKIALGFGIGAFLGILPGTGPVAAVFLAYLVGANRAAALLGSLLTNTWTSFVALFLAFTLGSLALGADPQNIPAVWGNIQKNFHWNKLMDISFLKVILPLVIGYIIIGLLLGLITYLITLVVMKFVKRK